MSISITLYNVSFNHLSCSAFSYTAES